MVAIWQRETKEQRWERAARVASACAMPNGFAHHFRRREISVMQVIENELRQRGECTLCLDAIADRAAVSRSTVKRAVKAAEELGWIEVTRRPRKGQKHLTNVIRVTLKGEREWLSKRGRGSGSDRPFLKNPIASSAVCLLTVDSGNYGDNLPRLGQQLRLPSGNSRAESG